MLSSCHLLRFISSNSKAYSPRNRGDGPGASSWQPQRDQTIHLTEFEDAVTSEARSIFLIMNFLFLTLDDEMYGTRARDNQVKALSDRKSKAEGCIADVVADALFRIAFSVRFRRRGDKQVFVYTPACNLRLPTDTGSFALRSTL